jgi:ribosome-associated heat shock protein Hsp15
MRIDKWLWAARFFKTRTLASDELLKGRVHVNASTAKPSKEIKLGDVIQMRQGHQLKTVVVLGMSNMRGPASTAQGLYQETPESVELRAKNARDYALTQDPASSIQQGRPTKRQRRDLDGVQHDWDERWSASIDSR